MLWFVNFHWSDQDNIFCLSKLAEIRAEQQRKYRGDSDWRSGNKGAATVSGSKSSSTAAASSGASGSGEWRTVPSSSATNYWIQPDSASPSPSPGEDKVKETRYSRFWDFWASWRSLSHIVRIPSSCAEEDSFLGFIEYNGNFQGLLTERLDLWLPLYAIKWSSSTASIGKILKCNDIPIGTLL